MLTPWVALRFGTGVQACTQATPSLSRGAAVRWPWLVRSGGAGFEPRCWAPSLHRMFSQKNKVSGRTAGLWSSASFLSRRCWQDPPPGSPWAVAVRGEVVAEAAVGRGQALRVPRVPSRMVWTGPVRAVTSTWQAVMAGRPQGPAHWEAKVGMLLLRALPQRRGIGRVSRHWACAGATPTFAVPQPLLLLPLPRHWPHPPPYSLGPLCSSESFCRCHCLSEAHPAPRPSC